MSSRFNRIFKVKMDIQATEERIIKEFELLQDWPERYKYIIKLGDKLDPLPEEARVEDNLVKGCQSQVWLTASMEDDNVIFKADSDAAITKGLVSLMDKIGMSQHLSPTRANGLASMVKQMKIYAMAFKAKKTLS
jgi:cysteine desulfuration protein SufE